MGTSAGEATGDASGATGEQPTDDTSGSTGEQATGDTSGSTGTQATDGTSQGGTAATADETVEALVARLVDKVRTAADSREIARKAISTLAGATGVKLWLQHDDPLVSLKRLAAFAQTEVTRAVVHDVDKTEALIDAFSDGLLAVVERRRKQDNDREGRV